MIDLMKIKLSKMINERLTYAESGINDSKLQSYINEFKYHLSVIPINAFEENIVYLTHTLTENSQYLEKLITDIFKNDYTKEEKTIYIVYCLLRMARRFIIEDELLEQVKQVINKSSNKLDVQFYIDEIKYSYLTHLTLNGSPDDSATIDSLLEDLEAVEASHNAFNIGERLL